MKGEILTLSMQCQDICTKSLDKKKSDLHHAREKEMAPICRNVKYLMVSLTISKLGSMYS